MIEPKDILKKYWGFDAFRPMQEEIIHAVLNDQDTLALLPTGGGKSICFQVTGLCLEGLTLVISPLIALMRDQVDQLKKRGIRASAIYSGMPRREIDVILDNCIYGNVKFLYLSPERLQTDIFKARAADMKVALIAIDEAHCISQWGYDFRPPYMEIAQIYPLIPNAKRIALTATATPDVSKDICEKLEFSTPSIFTKSFARKNLSYSVFELENKEQKMLEILRNVKGSGVIYTKSRKETVRIARNLIRNGVNADFYHAGLSSKERAYKQSNWIANTTRIIVATNAFGMGIDKPDVRIVIHLDVPDSMEAYYQEAGRAGRDGKSAFAVLLYQKADLERLQSGFIRSFPKIEFLQRVYQALANQYRLAVGSSQWQSFDFEIEKFCKNYELNPFDTYYAIKKLEEGGYILLNESFYKQSTVLMSIGHDELYKYTIANASQEPLIKALLRLYGGTLFTEFTKINESELARLSKSSSKEIEKKLIYLHQNNILVYDKLKDKPQLTFLTPRLDASRIKLDSAIFQDRREVVGNKIKHIIEYVENRSICRTALFQRYFGEQDFMNCGVCDICINQKKQKSFSVDLEDVKKLIEQKLSANWVILHDLKNQLDIKNDIIFAEAIRHLLDQNIVKINEHQQIRLNSKL